MIVMPSNSTGWFWHILAVQTGKLGHLYSPGGERGPYPWFPFALDNGAFACWNSDNNTFDDGKWAANLPAWQGLLNWACAAPQKCLWAIVPDVPGNRERTLAQWPIYAERMRHLGIPLALACQDGMTPEDVRDLSPAPDILCIGGSTQWKWETAEMWCKEFPRVHILRCNSPAKLPILESWGCESLDGTGWNRGDMNQTRGLEEWCRRSPVTPYDADLSSVMESQRAFNRSMDLY